MPKKGKKREKKVKKKKERTERDLVSYEQEITEKNRQLARLREENAELETTLSTLRQQLTQDQEDREDVQSHLTRLITQKSQEIEELNGKVSALEEKRKEDTEEFKKKEEQYKNDYKAMVNSLGAEVKMAAGKLSALEDWRLARLDLMQKFEEQEKNMKEQEERHTETLYNAEKSLVIQRSRMQESLKDSLQKLSRSLTSLSSLQISNTINRVLRENISLSESISRILPEATTFYTHKDDSELVSKLELSLLEMENGLLVANSNKRKCYITALCKEIKDLNIKYSYILKENQRCEQIKALYRQQCAQNKQLKEETVGLTEKLSKARDREGTLLEVVKEREAEYKKLRNLAKDVRSCLKEALQMDKEQFSKDIFENRLLHCFCNILNKDNLGTNTIDRLDPIPQMTLDEIQSLM